MSETYQIFVRPGFTGSSEGYEYVQKATKQIGHKPVMAYDRDKWIDYAMYPCESKSKVKSTIEGIIKAGKGFWASKKDLFISIDDDTKEFYPSGEYETKTNPTESDWEGFVLVEIKSGTKRPVRSNGAKINKQLQRIQVESQKPKTRTHKTVVPTKSSIKSGLSVKELFSAASSGMYWREK